MENRSEKLLQEGETLCDLAGELVQKGDYKMALEHYRHAESVFRSGNSLQWLAYTQHEMFICFQFLEQYEAAVAIAEEVIQHYQTLKQPEKLTLFLVLLGNLHSVHVKNDKAIEVLRMAEHLVKENNYTHLHAHIHSNLAACLINMKHYTTAITYLENAISEYEKLQQPQGAAWCLEFLGRCYEDLFMNDKAERSYFKAQRRYMETDEPRAALNALKSLVHLYGLAGKLDKMKQMQEIILKLESSLD